MKKIVALLCTLVMLVSMLPSIGVSAATVNEWATGTKQNAVVENGILVIDSTNGNASYSKGFNFSEKFTVKLTMRIRKYAGTTVLNIMNRTNRAGFYLQETQIRPHAKVGQSFPYAIGNTWHDYRIEVDTTTRTAEYYIDGSHVGTKETGETGTASQVDFSVTSGTILEIEDLSVQNYDGTTTQAVISNDEMPEDYTPAFVTDWKDSTDGWYIYEGPEVWWDKENGVVEYDVIDGSSSILYTVQRTVKTPDNFDFSFDMKIDSFGGLGSTWAIDGGGYHTYYYAHPHKLITQSGDAGTQIGVPVDIGNEWHTYTFKKRGEYLSILVDGGEVHSMKMAKSSQSIFRMAAAGAANDRSKQTLGKCVYTPYFPEVTIEKPYNRSEYARGANIDLKAKPETEVEYIDYYVNNVKVGRGYAPDYTYVLKNANVGTYKITAGIDDKKSMEIIMFVKAPYKANVIASKDEIKLGESVTVNIDPKDFSSEFKIAKAEYFVNNKLVGTSTASPFKVNVKDLKVGTQSIHAKLTNTDGNYVTTEAIPVNVWTDKKSGVDINREYEINYDYKSGNGVINIEDGYFKLAMTHGGDAVSYETYDGAKTYSLGKGKYKVTVAAGTANVYHNGHFAFSFALPRTEAADKITATGVENFTIAGPNSKAEYFHEEWKGEANYVKYLDDFGHRYALTLDPTDTRIAVNQKNNLVNYSLEFDKTDLSDEKIVYYDGEYRFVLDFKDGKINTEMQIKKGDNMNIIPQVLENDAVPGYYRVTVARGYAQVYADNKYIGAISAALDAHRQCIERTMTNPSASTFMAIKGTDDVFYHKDDFEGTNEFAATDYWETDEAVVATPVKEGNNTVLKLTGKGNYYLNAFTQDSVVKFRAKVAAGSDFYFVSRYSPRYYIVRTGYDSKAKKWYIEADNYDPYDNTTATYKKYTYSGNFTFDQWHDFEFIHDAHNVTLKCDGKTVFSQDEFFFNDSGNMGFGLNSGTLYFDDFSYEGRGKASAGIITNLDDSQGYHDFYQTSTGRVYASNSRTQQRYSDDGGLSWSEIEKVGYGPNVITLRSGKLLKVAINAKIAKAQLSDDDGATWYDGGVVTERMAQSRVCLNGALRETMSGRIFYTTDEGGSENKSVTGIYYSDDEGMTWTECETILDTNINGVNVQEVNIVDLPDGTVRVYGRSERGFVQFNESPDGGASFPQDGWQSSQLLASLCTFMIQRDNSQDNAYYAVISYCTENSWLSRYGSPRNRLVLLRSTDGCKSWQFAADILTSGDYPIGIYRNNSMDIFDGKLYISYNGADTTDALLYAIDLSKIKTLERWEECHETTFAGGVRADEFSERYTVISKKTGKALVNGNYVDVTVNNGMADANVLSRSVGASLVKSGNTVTFKIGEGTVKFTEGSADYEVNGETKTFSSACMKNGLIDIKAISEIFARPLYETDNSYTLYFDNMFNKQYADQIANLV